ncbi:MAG: ABC transporter ATP-binding protein [Promethearchaeota archaeon]
MKRKTEKKETKAKIYDIENDVVLEVKDLYKTYTTGKIKVHALQGINLKINKGEFLAIVGPSGAGKTTLINCLGALDFPDSGNIIYNMDHDGRGRDITTMDNKEHKEMRLNRIGLIFQFYNLFPVLTAYENVELPMLIAKKPEHTRKQRVEAMLKIVGLEKRMEHFPTQMSGGEQQRVTVARSMVNAPLILLADEPTGELDTETTINIMKIFLKIKEVGQSIIMVTHNQRIAEVADRILILTDGKITAELKGGKDIDSVFNGGA